MSLTSRHLEDSMTCPWPWTLCPWLQHWFAVDILSLCWCRSIHFSVWCLQLFVFGCCVTAFRADWACTRLEFLEVSGRPPRQCDWTVGSTDSCRWTGTSCEESRFSSSQSYRRLNVLGRCCTQSSKHNQRIITSGSIHRVTPCLENLETGNCVRELTICQVKVRDKGKSLGVWKIAHVASPM